MRGMSLEQIMAIKKHPMYHRLGKDGQTNYKISDFVKDMIYSMTDRVGMVYVLLHNKEKSLKAKVYVPISKLPKQSAWFICFHFVSILLLAITFFSSTILSCINLFLVVLGQPRTRVC